MVTDQNYYISHLWPLGVGRTRLVSKVYSRSPPVSYTERFCEAHMAATSRDFMSEDAAITGAQYRALRSGGVKQLHLGENELLLRYFHETVRAWLGERAPGVPESPYERG